MEKGVSVEAIGALREFGVRYKSFAARILEDLGQIEMEFARRWGRLEQVFQQQQQEMYRFQQLYEEAEEEDREHYAYLLMEARDRLRETRGWLQEVQEQYQAFRQEAQRIQRLASETAVKGIDFLNRLAGDLEAYVAVSLPETGADSTGSWGPERDGGGVPNDAGTGGDKGKMGFATKLDHYGLPPGFTWVRIDEIALEDPGEFLKVDEDAMREGIEKLPYVLDLIQDRLDRPFSDNSAYFERLDRQTGRDYQNGLQRVYEAFFGGQHIRLERWRGEAKWDIINGRHRIEVARELGLEAVPAVTEEVDRR
jgi:hypothetical protein